MKTITIASLVAAVSAHSWLECTNHDNSQLKGWMAGNSTLSPPVIIDPAMPWYSNFCAGWPRNKANPGNWIDESSNYIWNIGANSWNGGSYHPADTHACAPNQRSPNYQANAPMASAAAGSSIRLRFGGNGHTRGAPMGDAGSVTVYWKGAPEQEITDISEFTSANTLQTAGFGADSFSYPADPKVISPIQGLVDKGNWLNLNLPADMAPGRHMMVWVWSYSGAAQWSTCFDVNVTGGSGGASTTKPPAGKPADTKQASTAASVIPVIPVPVVNAQTPATPPKYDAPAAPAAPSTVAAAYDTKPDSYEAEKPAAPPAAAAPSKVPDAPAAPASSVAPAPIPSVVAQPQVQSPAASEGAPKKSHCKARYQRRAHSRAF